MGWGGDGGGQFIAETTRTINVPHPSSAADIQAIIDSIGKYIPAGVTVTVQLENATYTLDSRITVQGFFGGGSLVIQGDTSVSDPINQLAFLDWASSGVTVIPLLVTGNAVLVTVRDLKIACSSDSATAAMVLFSNNPMFGLVFRCYVYGTSTTPFSFLVQFTGCLGRISTCKISNSRYGLQAGAAASVYVDSNTGVTNAGAGVTNGLTAFGGEIRASGNASMGSNLTSNGGSIFT